MKPFFPAPARGGIRKLGADPHARFVGRSFGHLSEGDGHVPHQWFADEIARLDDPYLDDRLAP